MSESIDYDAESRARHDVLLLEDGAHMIRPLGRLSVTWYQLEKACLVRDPLFPVAEYIPLASLSDEEKELFEGIPGFYDAEKDPARAWLDESIEEKWSAAYPETTKRIPMALWRDGVRTVRDLLVLGKERTRGIRNFGDRTVERINDFIKEAGYPAVWQDEPTVEEIAELCDSLDQVLGLAALPPKRHLPAGMTVRDILETPKDERQYRLGTYNTLNRHLADIYAEEAYRGAEIFALRFEGAKYGLERWYESKSSGF